MKRRLISFILLLLTSFLTAFPQLSLPVKAAQTSGKCGENLTWSFDKSTGNLTITGSGDMMLDINESNPWRLSASASDIKSVSLPKGLTSIGEAAFSGCTSLTRITIPESVTNIGRFAFLGCSSLKSITIPDSVVDIDYGAFFDCSSLTSMTIPDSVEYLGDFVFSGCSSLTNIVIPSGVMHIGLGPFYKCSKLRSISVAKENSAYCSDTEGVLFGKDKVLLIAYPCGKTERKYIVPSSVSTIDNYAFSFSSALTNVEFPGEIRFFGEEAFYHCNNLKSVSLPDSVIRIRDKAFDECFSLEDIYFSGTKAKWEQIDIREGNTPLLNATIHYESATPVVPGGEGGGSESGENSSSILEECLKRPATVYDNELAIIAAKLCLKSYANDGKTDDGIRDYLTEKLGFEDKNIHSKNYGDSLAFTIATKEFKGVAAEDNTEIMVIVAQGTTTFYEMLKDATGLPSKPLYGYSTYDIVYDFYSEIMKEYVSVMKTDTNYKILLTGHSLGGAAANLTAFANTYWKGKEDIYCYTFGAINSINTNEPVISGYENIHNVYNLKDTFSPKVYGSNLPTGMGSGFGKFGKMELYSHDHRTTGDKMKATSTQMIDCVSHRMERYIEDLENEYVLNWPTVLRSFVEENTSNLMSFPIALRNTINSLESSGFPVWGSFKLLSDIIDENNMNAMSDWIRDFLEKYYITVIACPVDIEIYCDNQLVGRVVNNRVDQSVTTIDILVEEDTKFIIYPNTNIYDLRITAFDEGTMVFYSEDMSGEGTTIAKSGVSLEKGKKLSCEVGGKNKVDDLKLFILDSEGIPIAEVQGDGTEISVTNPFVDVKEGAYYYNAVLWAVNHDPQITNGTNVTHFSPDSTCTRAQVVTFLWRANGCPEPEGKGNPFTDVKPDVYYYKAVLWAVENGITTGTSSTTFSPNSGCTRGQVVTFLWRASSQLEPKNFNNPFNDVRSDAYYYRAVLWAVENEVTNGTSADKFSPNATCTRAQIVTFLYRAIT